MADLPRMVPVERAKKKCPVCGKSNWCLISPDGKAGICQRVESRKKCGEAGWLHRFDEPLPEFIAPPKEPVKRSEWYGPAQKYASQITRDQKAALCRSLGLPEDALNCLPLLGSFIGPDGLPVYTFPEQDGAGSTIGINRRFPDGAKKHMPGGGRGITLPNGWDDDSLSAMFIVEGPTDTAAMVAAGLKAIGRPSNRGGVQYLAEAIMAKIRPSRTIIVVGENDKKPDGLWPGLEGCMAVAGGLKYLLPNEVRFALAPTDYKDVRDFLTSEMFAEARWIDRGIAIHDELSANSHPATYCPEGYSPIIEPAKKELGFDEARWKY